MLNKSSAPYYDDYNQLLNFHQIMFNPGLAVQSRELTQLQDILQTQITRFGDSIYKDGALVTGGAQFVETVTYIKIAASSVSTAVDLIGSHVTSSNGSVYRIKDVATETSTDPYTLFVIPVTNVSGNPMRISASDTLTVRVQYTDTATLGTMTVKSSDYTGNSVYFSVDSGIYYTNGYFVRSEQSSICIDKYNAAPNAIVGFDVVENFVTKDDIELGGETLLDPAQGISNYAAPGADRYRIDLKLKVILVSDISGPVTTSSAFIELNRILAGQASKRAYANQYSLIGDTLARRTYDESGDYVVRDFNFRLEDNTSDNFFDAVIQPGKAYIKGYEIETLVPQRIRVPKARTTASVTGYDIPAYFGNYIIVSNITGGTTASLFDVSSLETVSFYSSTTPSSTNKIGTARVKSIEWISGSGTSTKYKLFLTDVQSTGNLFLTASVTNLAYNTYTVKANIDSTGITSFVGNTTFAGGVSNINVVASGTIIPGMAVSGTGIASGTTITAVNGSNVTLSAVTTGASGTTVTISATNFFDNNYDTAIFRIPHSNISSVSSLEYSVRRTIPVSIVTGTGSTSLSVSGERFKDVSSNTNISRHYIAIVASKTTGSLTVGSLLNITTSGTPSLSLNVSSTTLTLNVGDATFNGVVNIIATIDIQTAPQKTKTISVTPKQKTLGAGLFIAGATYSLGYADVNRIIGVYESVNSSPATTASTNITSRFSLNKNIKDAYYDHSTISLVAGATAPSNPILVVFECLEHSTGHGYFCANSYPVYNDIPTYTDNLGKVFDLRDCIDFRTKRVDDASATLQVYSASATLVGQQNIDTIYNFANANYSYYLSRIDKIALNKDGTLGVLSGIPALTSPQEPADSDNAMTLATLKIPAYTKSRADVVTTLAKNRRYTMRDVGKLDDRIARLEYYSSLNELEKEIVNTTFTNSANEVLFNSGFIVDSFRGHGIGNVNHPDYKCSIDFNKNILRPTFVANAAQWIMNTGNVNDLAYVNKKKFTMLPLNTTTPEVSLVSQTVASKTLSVNPFNVQSFIGNLRLLPDRDIWYSTLTLPDVVTNEANDAAAVQAGIISTTWGEWILTSMTTTGGNEVRTYTRTGEETSTEAKTVVRSSQTDVVSTTFSYEMRDQDIEYVVDGIRPNTLYSVFFDGINISGSCFQYNATTQGYTDTVLVTDSTGSARGVMKIRNNMFHTFKTGKKLVQISDGFWNPMVATTYCEAIFYSEGKSTVEQTSKVMGVDYVTVKRSVSDTTISSTNTYNPVTYNPPTTGGATSAGTFYGSSVVANSNAYNVITQGVTSSFFSGGNLNDAGAQTILNNNPMVTLTGGTYTAGPSDAQTLSGTINSGIDIAQRDGTLPASPNSSGMAAAQGWFSSGAAAAALGREPTLQEVALAMTYAATNSGSASSIVSALTAAASNLATNDQTFYGYDTAGSPIICQGDPTAQSFFISNDNPDGVFVSSIDTYFSQRDLSGTVPITLELRPTVNGYPDSYKVIPGSTVVKQPSEVNVPTQSQVNNPPATTWTFETPVHLYPGEYCLVLKSDSSDYRVYVAEIGGKKLGTDEVISTQQTLGSYFASQNATTWTPDQNIDLMFQIRRASFKTDTTYSSVFDLSRAKDSLNAELDVLYDMFNLNSSYGNFDSKTNIKFELSVKDSSDNQSAYFEVIPGNDVFLGYRAKQYLSGDTKLRITMSSTDDRLSPYAEVFPSAFIMVKNVINNGDVSLPDTLATGSGSKAVYITKPYVLQEGFDASAARVFLMENVPSGASIEVYMKGLSGNDASDIQDLAWIRMTRVTPTRVPADFYQYYDAEYFIENFSYSTYTNFRAVMFKIVMKTTDESRAPSAKKFRAIALA